jgi:5-methylcytosine-specific restriction protein A
MPMHFCATPGCPAILPRGTTRCPAHARQYDLQRGSAKERGYDSRWNKFSRDWRKRHPLCGERADGQRHAEHSLCVQ